MATSLSRTLFYLGNLDRWEKIVGPLDSHLDKIIIMIIIINNKKNTSILGEILYMLF
jgi:hypothetical protein